MDATWHAGPRGSATQTPRNAYVARHIYTYIYLLYIYKMFFVLPYMGRVIPLEIVGYYIPDGFI